MVRIAAYVEYICYFDITHLPVIRPVCVCMTCLRAEQHEQVDEHQVKQNRPAVPVVIAIS
jgi:hypothetical protein